MKQFVFEREFSVLFNGVKNENAQDLKEKILPIKNI